MHVYLYIMLMPQKQRLHQGVCYYIIKKPQIYFNMTFLTVKNVNVFNLKLCGIFSNSGAARKHWAKRIQHRKGFCVHFRKINVQICDTNKIEAKFSNMQIVWIYHKYMKK